VLGVLIRALAGHILFDELTLGLTLVCDGDMNKLGAFLIFRDICAHRVPNLLATTVRKRIVLTLVDLLVSLFVLTCFKGEVLARLSLQYHEVHIAPHPKHYQQPRPDPLLTLHLGLWHLK
jgi:hypothetical protein